MLCVSSLDGLLLGWSVNSQVVLLQVSLFKKVEQEFTERILEFQAQTLVNSLRAQRVLLKKVRSSVVSIHLICLIYLIFLIYLIYLIISISSISSILSILLIYLMYLVYLIYLIYLSICVFVYLKDLSLSLWTGAEFLISRVCMIRILVPVALYHWCFSTWTLYSKVVGLSPTNHMKSWVAEYQGIWFLGG